MFDNGKTTLSSLSPGNFCWYREERGHRKKARNTDSAGIQNCGASGRTSGKSQKWKLLHSANECTATKKALLQEQCRSLQEKHCWCIHKAGNEPCKARSTIRLVLQQHCQGGGGKENARDKDERGARWKTMAAGPGDSNKWPRDKLKELKGFSFSVYLASFLLLEFFFLAFFLSLTPRMLLSAFLCATKS